MMMVHGGIQPSSWHSGGQGGQGGQGQGQAVVRGCAGNAIRDAGRARSLPPMMCKNNYYLQYAYL